ncbi:MAG: SpaA isopeptide-forming pilin-related protein [Clostridium sp.]
MKKKINKLISFFMVLISILTFVSKPAYAESYIGTTGRGVDVGGWTGADGTTTKPIMIPPFTINGGIAYCCQLPLEFPVNFSYPAPVITDNYVYRGIVFGGYPADLLGLKNKYGLSDLQAEQYTQYALWKLTGGTADRRHPYVDELISAVNSRNYGEFTNIGFSIKNPTITITKNNEYQESNLIDTAGSPGTFTFPSNSNVWSVDSNGNKKDTFNIGESFKIRALLSYSGAYDFTIKARLKEPVAVTYKGNGVNQDLLGFEWRYRDDSATISAVFSASGSLSIAKVDDRGNKVPNVKFGIYSDSAATNLVKEGTTNSEGILSISDLTIGTYYVKELSVPQEYNLSDEIREVKIEAEKTTTITWENTIIKGSARMLKVDSVSGKPIAGAKFRISCANGVDKGKTWDLVSDENGYIKLDNYLYGTYYIEEISTIDGYVIQPEKLSFIIDENNEVIELKMTNDRIIGEVQLIKIDTETGKPLANADFIIICEEGFSKGATYNLKSDDNGIIKARLEYGKYSIKEVKSPEGYVLNTEPILFEITQEGQSINLTMNNDKITGNVQLIKIDTETGTPLANAEFQIICEEGFSKGETYNLKSDDNGIIKATLKYGKYSIVEVKSPQGYVLNTTPIPFEISENGQNIELKMTNDKIKGKVSIEKADKDNSDLKLKGAEFTIYDANGKEVEVLVTDNDGKALSKAHPYGKYTMKETKAPKGYKASDKVYEIVIDENGKVYEFTVENVIKAGKIIIKKVDADEKTKGIEGAEFTIYDLHRKEIETLVTDKDGNAQSKNLKFGRYIMKETKAPEGYNLDETIHEIAVSEDEMTIEFNLENSKISGDLEITKMDISDGKLLPNAEFIIRDESKEIVAKGVTDENGLAKFKLKYGKYTYQELNAPEGYIIDEGEYPFEIKENGEIVKAKMENEKIKGYISVEKVDYDNSNKKLAGAELTIYDNEGNVVEVLITDSEGKALSKALDYGTYRMKETKAPEGYILGIEEIEITITENEKVYEYTIENKAPLIETGGVDQSLNLAIGTIMTSAAGYVLFKKKKKD